MGVSVGVSLNHDLYSSPHVDRVVLATGFVVGSLSRRTLWVSAAVGLRSRLFCLSDFRWNRSSRGFLVALPIARNSRRAYGVEN